MKDDTGELLPGLAACSIWNLKQALAWNPQAVFALDALPPWIWEECFQGQVFYYPIERYSVLPSGMLERLTEEIASRVKEGTRVLIYSREDCGRISYVAACALYRLGIDDPVGFLKEHYSGAVPETKIQGEEIRSFRHRHAAGNGRPAVQAVRHIQIRSIEAFQEDEDVLRTFREIQESMGERGRFVIRFSGILPSVRITAESADGELCEMYVDRFLRVIQEKGHYVNELDW